ncbi:hypothetical protein TruAng_000879 [Truncatella angustata]|nr:hypothetical protein TruAng_000879 [Truncatella angustata]
MITQVLYTVVFFARYTDIFSELSDWNLFFKLFYIASSIYIIAIMRYRYARTREREIAWKLGAAVLGGSLLISPFAMLIFDRRNDWAFFTWLWDFSEILESVAVLPQLLLLRQTTVPTVINSGYILTLGSYRALYIPNWIWRYGQGDSPPTISVVFGIIQTAFYIDFAWVYYTRQRVKLRNGGIVDADDLSRGWLLDRIFGRFKRFDNAPDDEESAPALGGNGDAPSGTRRSKWGARGISVSADDDTFEHEAQGHGDFSADPDAKMKDPDELARVLDEDDDDEDTPAASSASSHAGGTGQANGVSNGAEWRD